jgi:hypothetical protein
MSNNTSNNQVNQESQANGVKFKNSLDETEYYTAKMVQFYELGVKSPCLLSDLMGISSDYVAMLICRKYKIRPVDFKGESGCFDFSDKMRERLESKGLFEGYLK